MFRQRALEPDRVAQCRGPAPAVIRQRLFEYEAVLGRATLFAQSRLNAAERDELLDIFIATCQWQRIYYGWRPNVADNNHLFELAVAAGAAVIVKPATSKTLALGRAALSQPSGKPQSIF